MAVGSQLASSFGSGVESAYATSPSPVASSWQEVTSSTLKRNKKTVQGGGLSGGNAFDRGSRRTQPWQDASGTVTMEVPLNKFGRYLSHFSGTTFNAVQQAATIAYAQTYPVVADNAGKSLTIQHGLANTAGTLYPYTFLGCKISSLELACDTDSNLTVAMDIDAQKVVENVSLVAPTYPATQYPFHGGQMAVNIGTAGSTPLTAASGVKGVSVKSERSYANERVYANAAGLKAEPVTNGKVATTGSLNLDMVDKTQIFDVYAVDGAVSMSFTWTGPLIASTYYYQLNVTMPYVYFDSDTPTIDGQDVVNTSVDFTALAEGTTSGITYTLTSTDTTI